MSALREVNHTHYSQTTLLFHSSPLSLPLSQSSLPPSPYDLVKFYLEHPTSYHHEGFVKADIVTGTGSEGESVKASLCRVPVNIILQNCHQQAVKVSPVTLAT